ncbi:MAG: NACHT domain-containing protein, partial [Candidatus Aminicenantes bacterium]|nr:NACHT domain-containing protein [Candidatus Aminicenantes bacterium]NIM82674.1 NACHT domain-containing protein [Candidatus Aminicenantes bacterium]NIN22047.1 NACHT domain-containing protein [Candidatus Aminicenantes bacterium]NIN45804.1 NACHT domain-containing protein [Candidatus Aminicenantes bacterium]NIN88642.1 NACHT domain-containing protein [Candidatus Aminicenantes bacterium]
AMTCLDKAAQKWKQLGFTKEILPIYFPLRELVFDGNDEPTSLTNNLARWCDNHFLNVPAQQFQYWLERRPTLVLLDGLDEISSKKQRQKVCKWIKRMCIGFSKACFVVASRATGFRKLDGIELELPHLRADIMDFSPTQQEAFLKKWFRAVYLFGLPPEGVPEQQWRRQQEEKADRRSGTIIEFLKDESNKAVQELAAVPMLLQIIAIIWKERKHLPRSRPALYDAALNYLLDYRDREREIEPLLPVEESRCVLAPAALWMQEELEKDEAPKKAMHQTMQPVLDTLAEQPSAAEFCEYLRDRAGLISDYDRDHYVFRHKSFREFLAALQLREDSHQTNRMETLIGHFGDNWWEESLRFFMSKSNDTIFDRFMGLFFQSPVSEQLDAHQQTLLQHLVREAPRKKIDALVEWLNNDTLSAQRRRYVMDCLKTIDTPEAIEAVNKADKSKMDKISRDYAEDIVAEASVEQESLIPVSKTDILETGDSFRNPIEGNVEYIKIPGGIYKYSLSGEMVTVPGLYFCKYPVTNKRYRRFIAYLAGKDKELAQRLPFNRFSEVLLTFAKSIEGYNKYLGNDPGKWQTELISIRDEDKRFNGD